MLLIINRHNHRSIVASRKTTQAKGQDDPRATNDLPERRVLNRRTEFEAVRYTSNFAKLEGRRDRASPILM